MFTSRFETTDNNGIRMVSRLCDFGSDEEEKEETKGATFVRRQKRVNSETDVRLFAFSAHPVRLEEGAFFRAKRHNRPEASKAAVPGRQPPGLPQQERPLCTEVRDQGDPEGRLSPSILLLY